MLNLHNSLNVFSKDIRHECVESAQLLMSFMKDIQGVCRILHNFLYHFCTNMLVVCGNQHTFIFHNRQTCITFNRILKL